MKLSSKQGTMAIIFPSSKSQAPSPALVSDCSHICWLHSPSLSQDLLEALQDMMLTEGRSIAGYWKPILHASREHTSSFHSWRLRLILGSSYPLVNTILYSYVSLEADRISLSTPRWPEFELYIFYMFAKYNKGRLFFFFFSFFFFFLSFYFFKIWVEMGHLPVNASAAYMNSS